ncbi:ABC transporter permease [Aureimonas sp. AU12]|uniref:ABC transporter permease n=1 Tax=Aureimonas sp. AU12 TaxID=1638161 RepID=UPI0007847941|nr:ABC transporter permease [Aureimonas sp. AU12]
MRALRVTLLGLLCVVLAWQATVWLIAPPRYMLPSPFAVAETLVARRSFLWEQGLVTLLEIALGLLFGTLAGIVTGFAVVAWPRLGEFAWPQILVLQAMPVFALAPLLVLWFGFGLTSKVVMASLVIFFPIASSFADGLRRTDPDLLDATAMTDASPMQALWHVRVPLAMPSLVTGLRVAAPLAPLGAVIGEWVGASGGLGFVMLQANARLQTDLCFAALAVLAVLTLLLRALVDQFAPRLAAWASESASHALPPSRQRNRS